VEKEINFQDLRPTDLLTAEEAMKYLKIGRGAWSQIKEDICFTPNPVRKFYQVQHLEEYKYRKTKVPKHLNNEKMNINVDLIAHSAGTVSEFGRIKWKESILN
jgi:hypothetical protein